MLIMIILNYVLEIRPVITLKQKNVEKKFETLIKQIKKLMKIFLY